MQEPTKTDAGEMEMTFADWKHRFASRCLNVVHEQAFGARTPTYRVIEELDMKVRSFYVPPSLRVPGFGGATTEVDPAPCSVELTMQRYIVFAIREITLFNMHKGFLARAFEIHPEDPLGTEYAPSVLAAYNSACAFVTLVKSLYSQQPGLTERMWFLFTHVLSCAIALGSIVTKCPSMTLATSALSHLESTCNLFESVKENARAAKGLSLLQSIKGRAMAALSQQGATSSSAPMAGLHMANTAVKQEDEELATLRGKTRLMPQKSPAWHSPSLPALSRGSSLHSSPAYSEQWAGSPYDSPSVFSPQEVKLEDQETLNFDHYAHGTALDFDYPSASLERESSQRQNGNHMDLGKQPQTMRFDVMQDVEGVDPGSAWRTLFSQYQV